jgi:hypothetical protein
MSYVKQSEELEELLRAEGIEPLFHGGLYYDISELGEEEKTIVLLYCEAWEDDAHYNRLVYDAHDYFDDFMNSCYEPYTIGYLTVYPDEAMKTDPVFYRTAFLEEIDFRGQDILDECESYCIDAIEELLGEEVAKRFED